jgi:anti-sigma-K factor RskA/putative zinc finger protein
MTDQRRPGGQPGGQPGGLTCDEVRDLAASFVLGALTDPEMDAVREHLADCPEIHDEFAELGAVVPALDAAVPLMEPPSALRDRILTVAAADLDARRQVDVPAVAAAAPVAPVAPGAPPAPAVSPEPTTASTPAEPIPIDSTRRRRPLTWLAGIAAVLAIVLLGAWNLSLQGQLSAAQTYQQQVASVLSAASQPGALTAVLAPPSGQGPNGIAAVTSDGKMRIAMRDLAPTTGDEVYEAWMILPNTPPAPVGGLTVGSDGSGFIEAGGVPAQPGLVLALTREPHPGMTAPSGDPVSVGTTTPTQNSTG